MQYLAGSHLLRIPHFRTNNYLPWFVWTTINLFHAHPQYRLIHLGGDALTRNMGGQTTDGQGVCVFIVFE